MNSKIPVTRHLGICIGASSISVAEVQKSENKIEVVSYSSKAHYGNPKQLVEEIF
jgi:Tfp pilus assembly PilM family ATPase